MIFLHESQGADTIGEAARVLIEDVHDAIFDLVELVKTYQSKNKLFKLFLSTLFKRRQDELDAVVDRAIIRFQVLQVTGVHHSFGVVGSSAPDIILFCWYKPSTNFALIRFVSPQLTMVLGR